MYASLPSRAYLSDIEKFLRTIHDDDSKDFTFALPNGLFSVHPIILCMLASLGDQARRSGGRTVLANEQVNPSTRYLERMGLFRALQVETTIMVSEHEAAGRFIPLKQVRTNRELNDFIVDFVPLLHASPEEAASVKYVLFELVRNVLEHSGSSDGAYVAAQVARKSGRLLIGVGDSGMGVRKSLSHSHRVGSERQAVELAFRPGITGATPRFGGNETNGGAGLFFMKAMATVARHHMVMITSDVLMKLLTQPKTKRGVIIYPELMNDRVKWVDIDTVMPGTAVGIDLTVDEAISFATLLRRIRDVYGMSVKEQKKARYRARFV